MPKHSNSLKKLFTPGLIGIYTWAWITSGIASVLVIIQGVFMECEWQVIGGGLPQFYGCSTSTNSFIYSLFIFFAFGGAGFSGYMGTMVGGTSKDGAKAGAVSLSISTLTEILVGYVHSRDIWETFIPLFIQIPASLIVAGLTGAIFGAIAGWLQIYLEHKKHLSKRSFIEDVRMTNDGFVKSGEEISLLITVQDPTLVQGVRILSNGKCITEKQNTVSPILLATDDLLPRKHLLQIEIATTSDPDWSAPFTKDIFVNVLPKTE